MEIQPQYFLILTDMHSNINTGNGKKIMLEISIVFTKLCAVSQYSRSHMFSSPTLSLQECFVNVNNRFMEGFSKKNPMFYSRNRQTDVLTYLFHIRNCEEGQK